MSGNDVAVSDTVHSFVVPKALVTDIVTLVKPSLLTLITPLSNTATSGSLKEYCAVCVTQERWPSSYMASTGTETMPPDSAVMFSSHPTSSETMRFEASVAPAGHSAA